MGNVFQVVQIVQSPDVSQPVPAVFWNGTFYNYSDALKRQEKGVEDIVKTFTITNIDPDPHDEYDEPIDGMRLGTGLVMNAERIEFTGYVKDYTSVYAVVCYEVK